MTQQAHRRVRGPHQRRRAQRVGEVPEPPHHRHRAVEEGARPARRRGGSAQAHPLRPLQRPEARRPRSPTSSRTARRPTRRSAKTGAPVKGYPDAANGGPLFVSKGSDGVAPLDGGPDPHRPEGGVERGRVGQGPRGGQRHRPGRDPRPGWRNRRRRPSDHGDEPVQRRRQRDDAEGGLGRPEREGDRPAAPLRLADAHRADARPRPPQDAPAGDRR